MHIMIYLPLAHAQFSHLHIVRHRSHENGQHSMYPNWGCFAPALIEQNESIYSKRKRHNISDACAAFRRSKVKCDEEKPYKRCVKHGCTDACISWRKVKILYVHGV